MDELREVPSLQFAVGDPDAAVLGFFAGVIARAILFTVRDCNISRVDIENDVESSARDIVEMLDPEYLGLIPKCKTIEDFDKDTLEEAAKVFCFNIALVNKTEKKQMLAWLVLVERIYAEIEKIRGRLPQDWGDAPGD